MLYGRYVDDIFLIVNNDIDAKSMEEKFNAVQSITNFTSKGEELSKVAFLDILLERNNDRSLG